MSKVDWGMYDEKDESYIAPSKKVETVKKKSKIDWDTYDNSESTQQTQKPQDNSFLGIIKRGGENFLNKGNEYTKTALKGTAEGLGTLGRMVAPSDENPQALQKQTENLDVLLPTKDEEFSQRALRRGLKELPIAVITGGESIIPRVLAAGFLGESGKELGLPEWGQTALEMSAYIGPDLMKKILSTGNNKEIIEFGKKMGLTDEQITPLIQSDFKQKWLSKLVDKVGNVQEKLEDTKKGLGSIYESLKGSKNAALELSEKGNGTLINKVYQKLDEIPREIRSKIEPDLKDLLENKITGKSLMNFWSDINSKYSGDKKRLAILKEPIKEALQDISPNLAKDFELTNDLYSTYAKIYKKLKPGLADEIVSKAEIFGLAVSGIAALYGHYPSLVAIATEKGARLLAKNMLTNPYFQQLSKKMTVAINENKYQLARKILNDFKDEIAKTDPETSKKIKQLSKEDFEDLINQKSKRQEKESPK